MATSGNTDSLVLSGKARTTALDAGQGASAEAEAQFRRAIREGVFFCDANSVQEACRAFTQAGAQPIEVARILSEETSGLFRRAQDEFGAAAAKHDRQSSAFARSRVARSGETLALP